MANSGKAGGVANYPSGRALPLLLNPFWANLPPAVISLPKDFFVYGVEFLPLGASATANQQFDVQSDSAFLILAGVGVVTDTANTVFSANVPQLVTIRDEGSGRNVFNIAQHFGNVFGTAQLPAYWTYPKILKPKTTVDVELQNLEATARNVRIGFWGFKLFKGPGWKEMLEEL